MPIDENNKALVKNRPSRDDIDFKKYLTRSIGSVDSNLGSIKNDMSDLKDAISGQSSREFEYQKAQERVERIQDKKFESYFEESTGVTKKLLGTFGDFVKNQSSLFATEIKSTLSEWVGPELNKGAMLTVSAIGKTKEASESLLTFFRKQKRREEADPSLIRGADAIEEAASGWWNSFRFRFVQGITQNISKMGKTGEAVAHWIFGIAKKSEKKETESKQEKLLAEIVDGIKTLNNSVTEDIRSPLGSVKIGEEEQQLLLPYNQNDVEEQKELTKGIFERLNDWFKAYEDKQKEEKKWRIEDRKRQLREEPEKPKSKSWITRLVMFLAGGLGFFIGLLKGYTIPMLKTLKLALLKPIQSLLIPFRLLKSALLSIVGVKFSTKIADFIGKVKLFFFNIGKSITRTKPITFISNFLKSIKAFFINVTRPFRVFMTLIGKVTGISAVFGATSKFFSKLIKVAKESGLFKLGRLIGKSFYVFSVILSVFDFIRGFTKTEGPFLEKLKAGLYAAFEGIFRFPVKIIGKAVDWVLGLFNVTIEGGAGAAMWDVTAKTFKTVMSVFFGYWSAVIDVIKIAATLLKEAIVGLWNLISPYVGPVIEWIGNMITNYIGPLFSLVTKKVVSFFNTISDAVSWLAKPLDEGETMWGRLKGVMKDLADSIKNWFVNLIDKLKFWKKGVNEDKWMSAGEGVPDTDEIKRAKEDIAKDMVEDLKNLTIELKPSHGVQKPEIQINKPTMVSDLDYSQHELWRLREKQKDSMVNIQR